MKNQVFKQQLFCLYGGFMKFISKFSLVVLVLLILVASAFPAGLIAPKQSYVGAALGLAWGFGISANYEYILQELPELQGYLGVGGEVGYAVDNNTFWLSDYKITYVPFFVFASYHYKMEGKLDPYVRLGLGYIYVNSTWNNEWLGSEPLSYIGIASQVGARYAINPKMFVRAALGTPWILSLGIDFKLD
jgi:hypothetical protein